MDPEQRRQGLYPKHNDYESGVFNLLAGSPEKHAPCCEQKPALGRCVEYPVPAIRAVQIPRPAAQRYHARAQFTDINIDLGKQSESISCSSMHATITEIAFQFRLTITSRFSRPDFDKYVRANKIQRTSAKPTDRRLDSLRHARAAHPAVAPHPRNGSCAFYAAMDYDRMDVEISDESVSATLPISLSISSVTSPVKRPAG